MERPLTRALRHLAHVISLSFLVCEPARSASVSDGVFDCVIGPKTLIQVASKVDGVLDDVTVERGNMLTRGQVIARIDSVVEELDVEIAKARARDQSTLRSRRTMLKNEKAKADRAEQLFQRNVTSVESREELITAAEIARLAVGEAEADLQLRALELRRAQAVLRQRTIRSPVDGVVHERLLGPGEYAHAQSPLMVIAEIDPLKVDVYLPVKAYGMVVVGQSAVVQPIEPIGGQYRAKVIVVDRVFDAASGTFGVELELPNPDYKLPAGIKCQVSFRN